MRLKIPFNYQLNNEVSWANFNTYKRIFNWRPFMHRVYDPSIPTEEQVKGQLDDTGLVNLAKLHHRIQVTFLYLKK